MTPVTCQDELDLLTTVVDLFAIVHSPDGQWGLSEYGYSFVLRILIDTNSYQLVIAVCFGRYNWVLVGDICWGRATPTSI